MEVPNNTDVVCVGCGNIYNIIDTESYSKDGKRICNECLNIEVNLHLFD